MSSALWKQSVPAESLRLYFAAEAALQRAPDTHVKSLADAFRQKLNSGYAAAEEAAEAAEALRTACVASGLALVEVEGASKGSYDEGAAQQVVPGLWLGPLAPTENGAWVAEHKITHILDATGGWRRRVSALENSWVRAPPPLQGVQYLVLDAEDRAEYNIAASFAQSNAFIGEVLRRRGGGGGGGGGGVLVAVTITPVCLADLDELPASCDQKLELPHRLGDAHVLPRPLGRPWAARARGRKGREHASDGGLECSLRIASAQHAKAQLAHRGRQPQHRSTPLQAGEAARWCRVDASGEAASAVLLQQLQLLPCPPLDLRRLRAHIADLL